MRHVSLAALAIVAAAPAGADVKAGVDAWAAGDFTRAVEEWRPAAVAGDADAQFNLGQAYKLGRGVPVDPALAESWFRKAALQGHEQAETNYGIALFEADRKAEAAPWLERSVARFEPRGQLVLGTMLFNGDGVKRDYPRAYALMTRASAAGLQSASRTLADMDGYITPADRERGVALAREYEAQARAMPVAAPARTATRVGEVPPTAPTGRDPAPTSSSSPAATAKVAPGTVSPSPKPAAGATAGPVTTSPSPRSARVATTAIPPSRPAAAEAASGPRPAPRAGGAWRVQLGAFRNRGNAEALWRKVAGRMSGAAPAYVAGGGVTRLQVGGYPTRAAASAACAKVASTGTPCVVVVP